MRAALVCAIAVAGCARVAHMSPGTTVPVADLYAERGELRARIARELDAGEPERAFYVLEVEKTRAYGAAWVGSRASVAAAAASDDLRPVFAELTEPEAAAAPPQRAIRRRPAAATKVVEAVRRASTIADDRYWHDLALSEARLRAQIPYGEVVRGHVAPVTSQEARLLFGPGEAYVSFFVERERVHAFVLWQGELRVHTLAAGTTALRGLVAALLDEVQEAPATAGDTTWRAASRALAAALIDPLPELADPELRAIYVSPDRFLGCVPFAILLDDGDRMLLERARVTSVLSASAYRKTIERAVLDDPPVVLAVGEPIYPAGVAALAMAGREIDTVSDVFDSALLLRDADATEGNVRAAIAESNILHFATHGVILGDVVEGATSLLVSADDADDGFLSVAEIAGLDLAHVYLAVLSACETSVGASDDDATDLSSLLGAFLGAGVRTVIGTLWPVADEATLDVMLDFYRRFLERGGSDALRDAQLEMSRAPELGHPYFWAAFVLSGWDR